MRGTLGGLTLGVWGVALQAGAPTNTPSPVRAHPLFSLPSYTQSHLCHVRFHWFNEHNKYISSLLMNAIWQPRGWQAGEDGHLIEV